MDDSELGQLLARAADEFPVLHRPLALERRVTRRRRITTAFAFAAGAAALTGAAILIPFMMTSDGTTKPASTASGGYVGSRWQLTSVADGTTSTPIPGDAGANIEFWTDGRIVVRTGWRPSRPSTPWPTATVPVSRRRTRSRTPSSR
jgi:hypothetical protein